MAVYHADMTYREAREASGLEKLDAEMLLATVTGKSRTWIVTHEEKLMDEGEYKLFVKAAERRILGEPIAHIIGEKEFYGRMFSVTKDTLIPRPSTEYLVEGVLQFLEEKTEAESSADTGISILSIQLRNLNPDVLLDIGTGSGCIAVTLEKEGWNKNILAIDTSAKALVITKKNIAQHACKNITCLHKDGGVAIQEQRTPFLIVSNPPYIPLGVRLEPTVKHYEPHKALFAGKDGTDVLFSLIDAAVQNPYCMGVVLELRTDQVQKVKTRVHSGMMLS